MMHKSYQQEINSDQASLLSGRSMGIDEITNTILKPPTNDLRKSFSVNRDSHVSIKNNGSVIRTNHKADLNHVLVDRK